VVSSRRNVIAHEVWADAVRELGAAVSEIERGRFEIRRGAAVAIVTGQTAPLNSDSAMALAADKPAVHRLLADAGLPIPEQLSFAANDLHPARRFLERDGPCVMKPARGTGGDGVTGEIRSVSELRRAALAASRFAPQLLIERQVTGEVFRLLVLDGQVLDVVRRRRPAITGDGRSTVEELIFAENDRRIRGEGHPGLKAFVVDLDCILSLRRAGVPLRSVLPEGATLRVKTVTNYNTPEENETFRGAISPGLTTEVTAAAEVLGLRLAGVDVITPTLAASLAASGGCIVDVNEAPGLHHHAHVANAASRTRVAVPIVRALLDKPIEHLEMVAQ
jgi:cyanophycin synthetase